MDLLHYLSNGNEQAAYHNFKVPKEGWYTYKEFENWFKNTALPIYNKTPYAADPERRANIARVTGMAESQWPKTAAAPTKTPTTNTPINNPASRYVQEGINRFGPGSQFNEQAWARPTGPAPLPAGQGVRPGVGQVPTWGRPPTGKVQIGLTPRNATPPTWGRPPPTGTPPAQSVPPTPVPRPAPTPTTPARPPASPIQSIAPPSLNNTWGRVGPPPVMNNGNIINATDELGLGPFAQYLQNIANPAAHETNMSQFYGSAPSTSTPNVPRPAPRPGTGPVVTAPGYPSRPTPAPAPAPVYRPPSFQQPAPRTPTQPSAPTTPGMSAYQKAFGMSKADYMRLYNQGIRPPQTGW
jgi:hypothetical protein